jgi:hypothetical protein
MTTLSATANDYYRPTLRNAWLNRVMQRMPPITATSEDNFEIQPINVQPRHYLLASVSVTFMTALGALMFWAIPAFRYSAISASGVLVREITGNELISAIFVIVFTYAMIGKLLKSISIKKGALKNAALREELTFRAGSEDWKWRQRLTSNVLFGAVHLLNLYVPLAAVFSLSTGGWWFMSVYRNSYKKTHSRIVAIQESAAVHAAHNTLVIFVLLPVCLTVYSIYTALNK